MKKLSNPLLWLVVVICLLPGLVMAQVTGIWNTTGLTRVDVTAIKALNLVPEHTVEVADSSYEFKVNGDFVAGDIRGKWLQRKNQYNVAIDRLALENQYRLSLEQTPGLVVNQIKLVKTKLAGSQLDNGLWGGESYEYRVDTTLNGRREVLKVLMTLHVASASKQTLPVDVPAVKALQASPQHSSLDTAATAVVNYLNHH